MARRLRDVRADLDRQAGEAAARLRAAAPPGNGKHAPPPSVNGTDRDPFADAVDLTDLLDADLPDPEFVADGLLPKGLVILAAKPKVGKSWKVLQTAICIVSGRPCLGTVTTRRAPVLYLALEDTRHRIRSRSKKLIAGLGWSPSRGLTTLTSFPRAGSGGLAKLAEWFADHPGGVVIIDTLAKFRDPRKGRDSYEADYEACGQLKALADAHGGLIVVVLHTRKCPAVDPFDEVSGTLGLTGAADATMVLDRERGAVTGTLYVTGRDLADTTLTLGWDADHGIWTVTSRDDGIHRTERPGSESGSDRCVRWLEGLMAGYAWPDAELVKSAKLNGFSEWQLRSAKDKLREREDGPRLCSTIRGKGGAWWNWLGEKGNPPPDRPQLEE